MLAVFLFSTRPLYSFDLLNPFTASYCSSSSSASIRNTLLLSLLLLIHLFFNLYPSWFLFPSILPIPIARSSPFPPHPILPFSSTFFLILSPFLLSPTLLPQSSLLNPPSSILANLVILLNLGLHCKQRLGLRPLLY